MVRLVKFQAAYLYILLLLDELLNLEFLRIYQSLERLHLRFKFLATT
jgi:hypothetical protein